jgi:hypothetical protein
LLILFSQLYGPWERLEDGEEREEMMENGGEERRGWRSGED